MTVDDVGCRYVDVFYEFGFTARRDLEMTQLEVAQNKHNGKPETCKYD